MKEQTEPSRGDARPDAVILVPTYNERDNITPLLERVLTAVPNAHVLIIDDDSPDDTGELADAYADKDPMHVSVLHRTRKEGLGAAYAAGYLHALDRWPEVPFFIQMDADLSHDPAYLPGMLAAMDDADVVVASRYVQGVSIVNWPLHRLVVSKCGTAFARIVAGMPLTDCTSGFKCYRREVFKSLDLKTIRSNGYVFQVETSFRAWRAGFRLKDFPIIFYERQRGKSKLNLSIAFEAFLVVLRLGFERLYAMVYPVK